METTPGGNGGSRCKLTREMGLSHREFFRTLPAAMGTLPFSIDGLTVTAVSGSRQLVITLAPETKRQLGLLSLPTTRITFEFSDYTLADVDAFMHHFERRYQRGGG